MIRWFVAISVSTLFSLGGAPVGGEPVNLTLRQAVEVALRSSPALKAAEAQVGALERLEDAAGQAEAPRLDVTYRSDEDRSSGRRRLLVEMAQGTGLGGSVTVFGDVDVVPSRLPEGPERPSALAQYGFRVSQEVFTDNTFGLARRRAEARVTIGRLAAERAERALIEDVTQLFYAGVQAEESVRIWRERAELAEALVNLLTEQLRRGVVIAPRISEAQVNLALARANLRSAEGTARGVEAQMEELLGIGERLEIRYDVSAERAVVVFDREELADALREHPDVREMGWRIELARLDLRDAARELDRKLAFNAEVRVATGPSATAVVPEGGYDWAVGVQADIPLFDSGVVASRTDAVRYDIKRLQWERESRIQQLALRAGRELEELQAQSDALQLYRQARQAAEQGLLYDNDRFVQGLVGAEDLIRSQQNLSSAKLSETAAAAQLGATMARLYVLTREEAFRPW